MYNTYIKVHYTILKMSNCCYRVIWRETNWPRFCSATLAPRPTSSSSLTHSRSTSIHFLAFRLGLGRIFGYLTRKSRISDNIRQGMPDNPAGYPARKTRSGPTLVQVCCYLWWGPWWRAAWISPCSSSSVSACIVCCLFKKRCKKINAF